MAGGGGRAAPPGRPWTLGGGDGGGGGVPPSPLRTLSQHGDGSGGCLAMTVSPWGGGSRGLLGGVTLGVTGGGSPLWAFARRPAARTTRPTWSDSGGAGGGGAGLAARGGR